MTPDYQILIDGEDKTEILRPHLQSLEVYDDEGHESDTCNLVLTSRDIDLPVPPVGTTIEVRTGYAGVATRSNYRPVSLALRGRYKVAQTIHTWPDRLVTVEATGTDFGSSFVERRQTAWHNTTLGAMLGQIAGRNGLTPSMHPNLTDIPVQHIDQDDSDAVFLVTLGRQHDMTAVQRSGYLVARPIGLGQTGSGQGMPSVELSFSRRDVTDIRLINKTERKWRTVRAHYHDPDYAELRTRSVGNGGPTHTLRHPYPNRQAAEDAARAKLNRAGREGKQLEITLPGHQMISAETPITLTGYGLTDGKWIVRTATHTINDQGYVTALAATPPTTPQ